MNIKEYLTNANAIDCGEYYILTCPKCHRREAYLYKDDIGKKKMIPIRCNRLNNCGEKSFINTDDIQIEEKSLTLSEEERKKQYSRERARVVTPEGRKYLLAIMKAGYMLKGFDFDYRGISNSTLKKYNIIYLQEGWIFWLKRRDEKLFGKMYFSPKYENRNILIPLYSIDGELDRILLRSKDGNVEPKEIQCRINQHGEEVFNIQALKSKVKNIFVCEGAFDAIRSDIEETFKTKINDINNTLEKNYKELETIDVQNPADETKAENRITELKLQNKELHLNLYELRNEMQNMINNIQKEAVEVYEFIDTGAGNLIKEEEREIGFVRSLEENAPNTSGQTSIMTTGDD